MEKKPVNEQSYRKPSHSEFIEKIRQEMPCYLGLSQVYDKIYTCLDSDPRQVILITGERGVGKELVTDAIHKYGDRKGKPFITVDTGAIPKELIASELFGHIKGAFTGAIKDRIGKFQEANGGILFLDEIGNLSLEAQAMLLRAIEYRKIVRVGDEQKNKDNIDVKIITATNMDLLKEKQTGNFRDDLYDRLKGYLIDVEPLRERSPDIPVLIRFFVERENERTGKSINALEFELFLFCICHDWQGNVRELENFTMLCHMNCRDGQAIRLNCGCNHFSDHRWPRNRTDPLERVYEAMAGPPPIAYFKAIFHDLGEYRRKELKRLLPFKIERYHEGGKEHLFNVYPEVKLTDIPQGQTKHHIEMPEWIDHPHIPHSHVHEDSFWERVKDGNLTKAERTYVEYITSPNFDKWKRKMDEDMKYEKLVTDLKTLYETQEKQFRLRMALQSFPEKRSLFDLQYKQAKDEFDKEYIKKTLERNKQNKTKTAEEMRVSGDTLYKKLRKYGLLDSSESRSIRKT